MNPLDPRVEQGMRRQLAVRAIRLAAGEQPIGWKAGFGAPSARSQFSLEGPLVGFLSDRSLVRPGSEVSIAGWLRPVAEPELAVYLGADLAAGAGPEEVEAAVASIGPALELADVHPPPSEVAEILAGNIFHRAVILGDRRLSFAQLGDLQATVRHNRDVVEVTELEALTGPLQEILAHLAATLVLVGETARAGEVVICGSVVPPIALQPGDEIELSLQDGPPISVTVAFE